MTSDFKKDGTAWNNQRELQKTPPSDMIVRVIRFNHSSDDRLLYLVFLYKWM